VAPRFSIVLCTHDRVALLRQTLASLARLDFPRADHQLVLVDNASTDGTAAALADFVACHEHAVTDFEPRPGHTRSRNRGVALAQGRILVFVDDDVSVPPEYLTELAAAYAARPAAAGFGGRIVLDWETGRPAWLWPELETYWVGLDLGPAIVRFEFPRAPFGANMSFRREWLERVGGFDVGLGYSFAHGRLSARDDMELGYRIMRAGGELYYAPAAWLTHHIPADRCTVGYLLDRAYGQGYADYQTFGERARWGTAHKVLRLGLHAAGWLRARLGAAASWPLGAEQRLHLLYRIKLRYNAGYLAALVDHLR
jgi:GT2 family glycosyltransferase